MTAMFMNKWYRVTNDLCHEEASNADENHPFYFGVHASKPDDLIFISRDGKTISELESEFRKVDFLLRIEVPPKLMRLFTMSVTVKKIYEYSDIKVVASSLEEAEAYVESLVDNGDLEDFVEDDMNATLEGILCDEEEVIDEDAADDYPNAR